MPAAPSPLVLDHSDRVALLAAELIANRMRAHPQSRLLLPTGRTPVGMYAALRAHAAEGALPTEGATVFQLDEYLGVPPQDPRSFAFELRGELEGIPFAALHGLDGGAADPEALAARHQALLDEAPIDVAVLGLGRDGHVAFDEPGSPVDSGVRRVALTNVTRRDAAEAWGGIDHVPTEALTVGLRTIADARRVLVLVTGSGKAEALRAMLEGPLSSACPASLLRNHPRLTIICDRAAVSLLRPRAGWGSDRALVVLGHREPGISVEHRASAESFARLRHAVGVAERSPVRAAILTGWTRTGGLSEAEQMLTAWNAPDTPALLEVAGRNTAENASRSLPLLLAMGGVRRVTVVTSAWHFRARWFFAVYKRFGLEVSYRPVFARGSWLRGLAEEIRQIPTARGERRAAMAALRLPPEARRQE